MASSDSNDCKSQLTDTVDKVNRKVLSSEHEETLKVDQMAAKKLSNEKVSEQFWTVAIRELIKRPNRSWWGLT